MGFVANRFKQFSDDCLDKSDFLLMKLPVLFNANSEDGKSKDKFFKL